MCVSVCVQSDAQYLFEKVLFQKEIVDCAIIAWIDCKSQYSKIEKGLISLSTFTKS